MAKLQDEITLLPSSSSNSTSHKRLLVFFICGNPGLIEYYHAFLQQVHQTLQANGCRGDKVIVYGASHDGFEIHPTARPNKQDPPYSLREVIEGVKRRLQAKAREVVGPDPEEPLQVVLIGHSVGSYMLLEVLEWWQKQKEEQAIFNLLGGICLFPTVVDIAKSPRGKVLNWVLAIPFLPVFLQSVARCLACVPTSWVNWPKLLNPGPQAMDVTEALIRSRHGVGQVIYMANDEMREIKGDKWHPANIWGMIPQNDAPEGNTTSETTLAINSGLPKTKLFFYWGKNDYWVDNQSRDALIAAQAQTADDGHSSHMYIDPGEIPHTFSMETKDMVTVADKVAEWITELQTSI